MTSLYQNEFSIEKEDADVIFPTRDDEIVFAISVKEEDPVKPKILYDGKEHALLYRSETDIVILDYLPEKIKEKLQNVDEAYIVEIDYRVKKMKYNYDAFIELVEEYPFDITKYLY